MSKKIAIGVGIVALIIIGFFVFKPEKQEEITVIPKPEPIKTMAVIGSSVEDRDIEVYTFGDGEKHLLFVGGIHGGYEWNSVLLAYKFIDYFDEDETRIPESLTISIIPNLNPDGLYKVIGKEGRFLASDIPSSVEETKPGRFNVNGVDLNRNFDCKWAPESTWQGRIVSAGESPFSEPEAVALKNFVEARNPESVVFWHSKANTVYASECEEGILPATLDIMNLYAQAADYNTVEKFDAYEITGDAEGWLASIGIPAITVELETRDSIEWERNLAGVNALFDFFVETQRE